MIYSVLSLHWHTDKNCIFSQSVAVSGWLFVERVLSYFQVLDWHTVFDKRLEQNDQLTNLEGGEYPGSIINHLYISVYRRLASL